MTSDSHVSPSPQSVHIQEAASQVEAPANSVSGELSPPASRTAAFSPRAHAVFPPCAQRHSSSFSPSYYKDTSSAGLDPTLMTSLIIHHLLTGDSKYSHIGIQGFNLRIFRGHKSLHSRTEYQTQKSASVMAFLLLICICRTL